MTAIQIISCIVLSISIFLFVGSAMAGGDLERGKALVKSWSCIQCHGLTGNDRSAPEFPVPMLAGQPEAFIVSRLMQYKSIKMEHNKSWTRMATFAQGLSRQDMMDIGAYYEAQKRY